MFLRYKIRRKNGKERRNWSIVENRRVAGGRVVQRQVLYLGEINDSQELAWRKSIELFAEEEPDRAPMAAALFPEDRPVVTKTADQEIVRLQASAAAKSRCKLFVGKPAQDPRQSGSGFAELAHEIQTPFLVQTFFY